ncbi:MAG: Asp23/Gls24 family envelope stress response protein [Clostridia bacterium]|nr:Asp23/Gls24 family envelope stress response protein [Clostridia bacterium]
MNNATGSSATGLVISDEVIASIAMSAVKDVAGIGKLVQRPTNLKGMVGMYEGAQKYVEVYKTDNVYTLKLHITVNDDCKIPIVAAEVQKSVKNAVQEMTSKVVSKVNVVIAGVESTNNAPNQKNSD